MTTQLAFNQIKGNVVSVKDFGAVGDGVTDDSSAINAACDHMRTLAAANYLAAGGSTTSPHHVHATALCFPPGRYKCNSSIWFGSDGDYNDHIKNVIGFGAVIESHAADSVALDLTGAYGIQIYGLKIWGDATNTPDVGVLCARDSTGASAGKHRFIGVELLGYYDVAAYYNYGAEVCRWTNCEIRNIKSGGLSTCYFTSSNVNNPVTSPNTTIATGYQSSYGDVFNACDIHFDIESNNATITSATNAPVIIESVDYGPKFYQCYIDVLQGATNATPCVRFRSDAALGSTAQRTEGVVFEGCTFEDGYDSVLRFESSAVVQHTTLRNCSLAEAAPGTADIVIESGADMRRYDFQRLRGINAEVITYSDSGTLREQLSASGFKEIAIGSTWDYNETGLTLDGTWRTLNLKSDVLVPNDPVKVFLKVRVKTTGTVADANKAQFRGSSSDHDPADYFECLPQVANIWSFFEGWVNVASGGTIDYKIPSTISEIDIKVKAYAH